MRLFKKILLMGVEIPLRLILLVVGGIAGWLGIMAFLSLGPEDSVGPGAGAALLPLLLAGFALSAAFSPHPFWRNDHLKSLIVFSLIVILVIASFVGVVIVSAHVTSLLVEKESHLRSLVFLLVLIACGVLEYALLACGRSLGVRFGWIRARGAHDPAVPTYLGPTAESSPTQNTTCDNGPRRPEPR